MKKYLYFFFLLSTFYFLLSTAPAAQAHTWTLGGGAIVPCGTISDAQGKEVNPCTRCDFFHLLKHLIDFGVFAVIPVGGTLLFITAGIFYILGAGNPSYLGRAKNLFINTFYGIIIIALAWLITNTILSSLASNTAIGFQCINPPIPTPLPVPSKTPPPEPTITPTGPPNCDPQFLAGFYGTSPVITNSPTLDTLVTCIKADPIAGPLIDVNQVYTVENSQPLCNYTRGNTIPACGITKCAHAINSCHYGGATGKNGAEGVDWNAKGGSDLAENQLYAALRMLQAKCGFKQVQQHNCPGTGCHSHMSAKTCDKY